MKAVLVFGVLISMSRSQALLDPPQMFDHCIEVA